ncbi:BatA domain-containing protein [Candidatus Uabimicrobium sp. HlEnr_7]|uniref:BatA domain-containing protein n=1 Tax=Candidatus Uabimicrobium helgolandensis TaxID=3095367 RepID=UPI003555C473
MNLHFIHANVLYFAAAGMIPIIIHLIFRKRYKKIQWAAMKFLLAAYKKNKRSLLVENLLLLLIRILIIILLVLMFARPTANESFLSKGFTRLTDHYIVLLDNSFSMSVRDGNTSPFERAKDHIRKIIKNAKSGDSVTLTTLNEQPKVIDAFHEVSPAEKGTIIQQMESIKPSEMGTDVINSTNVLLKLIESPEYTKYKNKKVFILTDLQRKPWTEACKNHGFLEVLEKIGDRTQLTMVDVGITSDPANLTVQSIETDGVIGVGGLTRFVATIRNNSSKNAEGIAVNFFVRSGEKPITKEKTGKQGTEYISISAGEQQRIPFFYNFARMGSHSITVDLTGDNLIADNEKHLIVKVVKSIRVLVIDGDGKEEAFESETDHLMAAIGQTDDNIIQAKAVGIGNLSSNTKFKDYDVIILANLQTFDDERRFEELQEFVRKGGGLFIWLGDKVPVEYYNTEFYGDGLGILPGKLDGNPIGKASDKEDKTTFKLDEVKKDHKVLKYFVNNKDLLEDFRNYFTYKFFPVKIDPDDENVSVIAAFDHPQKYPALIERIYGRGKIILSTTTADKQWNNLHSDRFGYVFLIMIHEFIQYLVSPPVDENNIFVGTPIVKKFPYYIGEDAEVTAPQKSPIKKGIYASDKGGPPYKVEYTDTLKSGVYHLKFNIPEQVMKEQEILETTELFAVNVNPEEGNIHRLSQNEILAMLDGIKISFKTNVKEKNSLMGPLSDSEYWKPILLLILLLSLMETFMAMWFGRYDK